MLHPMCMHPMCMRPMCMRPWASIAAVAAVTTPPRAWRPAVARLFCTKCIPYAIQIQPEGANGPVQPMLCNLVRIRGERGAQYDAYVVVHSLRTPML